jgi:hypothetical protein
MCCPTIQGTAMLLNIRLWTPKLTKILAQVQVRAMAGLESHVLWECPACTLCSVYEVHLIILICNACSSTLQLNHWCSFLPYYVIVVCHFEGEGRQVHCFLPQPFSLYPWHCMHLCVLRAMRNVLITRSIRTERWSCKRFYTERSFRLNRTPVRWACASDSLAPPWRGGNFCCTGVSRIGASRILCSSNYHRPQTLFLWTRNEKLRFYN